MDAYLQFEEGLLEATMESQSEMEDYNTAEMSGTAKIKEALSNEDAMKMIAEQEGMQIDQKNVNTGTLSSFVSGKRSAQAANLEEVEERVAKLRKATAGATETKDVENGGDGGGDADKIDIDDKLDNDDEEEDDDDNEPEAKSSSVQNVATKAVPAAVFGGLVGNDNKK
jgi:hypothetical protein